ncbi:MAG: hypothetical protein ACI88H_003032 [Cocleimonas sp.]|jgi:hypothetical protein
MCVFFVMAPIRCSLIGNNTKLTETGEMNVGLIIALEHQEHKEYKK